MRTGFILGTNLVVGAGALAYVLRQFGGPALGLLGTQPRIVLLAGVPLVVLVAFLCYAARWRLLLAGLGARVGLAPLTAYRAAGQSLSSLVPSGKLGGEPLRALLLVRDRVPSGSAIASVAVDRAVEMGAGAPFVLLYAALLLRRGVPELEGAFVSVTLGVTSLAVGVLVAARRLRRGAGLVTALARSTGLARFAVVQDRMGVLAAAEDAAARLLAQPRRLSQALGASVVVNLLVLVEYYLLLTAFQLPAGPVAVVAATFATGAAHSLPVPAAVGTLEGAQMWLFGMLGHPPEVGLAVALAVRLRELLWVLPGLVYLMARGLRPERLAATVQDAPGPA